MKFKVRLKIYQHVMSNSLTFDPPAAGCLSGQLQDSKVDLMFKKGKFERICVSECF